MLVVEAVKSIKKNNQIVGYVLRDANGHEMQVSIQSIINAVNTGKASISNLFINKNGEVEFIKRDNSDSSINNVQTSNNDELEKKKNRIHELIYILNTASKSYYTSDKEIMSNYEWDKAFDELKTLEKETGIIEPNSPTQNVGYIEDSSDNEIVDKLQKEKHSKRMLSLGKTKDVNELVSFLGNKDGVLSWKLDGLTVVIIYNNGVLEKAITRGNGDIGEIVTHTAKTFKNLPKRISFNGRLEMRGEAVIKQSDFNRINVNGEYKNARNLASGSVRQLDSNITASRNVNWYCFEVVSADNMALSNDIDKQLNQIKMLGFDVVEHYLVNSSNIIDTVNKMTQDVKTYDIPCDGLVLTYNDKAYGLSLGETAHEPRHSKAFKWEDEVVKTTLIDIEWSPSRNGLLTPVAIFEPVDIEGSTVQRASLHNVSIFADLELGYGDTIGVYKANMIIPQISANFTRSATCEIPGVCPCCYEPTEVKEEEKSGVLTLCKLAR